MAKISSTMPPLYVLSQLEKAKSSNTRKKIIKKAWDSDSEDFFVGVQLCLDKTIPIITSVPEWEGEDSTPGELTMERFYSIVQSMRISSTNLHETAIQISETAGIDEWNKWYRKILNKTLNNELPMNDIIEVLQELTSAKNNV